LVCPNKNVFGTKSPSESEYIFNETWRLSKPRDYKALLERVATFIIKSLALDISDRPAILQQLEDKGEGVAPQLAKDIGGFADDDGSSTQNSTLNKPEDIHGARGYLGAWFSWIACGCLGRKAS
jgi:hypothetical protein